MNISIENAINEQYLEAATYLSQRNIPKQFPPRFACLFDFNDFESSIRNFRILTTKVLTTIF